MDPSAVQALLAGAGAASPVPRDAPAEDASPPTDGGERLVAAGRALAGPRTAVQAWAAANPQRFAGLWFDSRSGRTPELVVGVVADPEAGPDAAAERVRRAADELAGRVGTEVGLRVVARERPEADLVALQGSIEREQMTSTDLSGTHVTAVGVDPEAGRVEVCISEHDPAFARRLEQRYGPDVLRVEQGIRLAPLSPQPRPSEERHR